MSLAIEAPPQTAVDPVTDVLHGIEVVDPYRWLEDQNCVRTREWIEQQAEYAQAYLSGIPSRQLIRRRVDELLALKSTVSEPWLVGDRYFFLKRLQKNEQPAIVTKVDLFGEETVLVDPRYRGLGPHATVSIVAISDDGRFLAYSVRQGGTDHSAIEILDIEQNSVLPDRLPDGFCTGLVFNPDGSGFFYSHRNLNDSRPNYQAVRRHVFGADFSTDQELFFAGEQANLFVGILCSAESGLLAYPVFITGKERTTSLYVQALQAFDVPKLVLKDLEGFFVPFFLKDRLLAYTDFGAPNFHIVEIDVNAPEPRHWKTVVPESGQRIQQFAVAEDEIFVTRIDRFQTIAQLFALDGKCECKTALSLSGSIDVLNRTTKSSAIFYSCTTISTPSSLWCYDSRGKKTIKYEAGREESECEIEVNEVTYPSLDGVAVPLLLAARKDRLRSGPLPTFLTGYGGFGSCVTPRFTAFATFLIEQGFLFAVPALRGGSELGEEWHRAGMREHRQNSFDDFIGAAQWLIAEGRAERDRIAIGGGSNAGLLVGAAITQRPDLFRAAICLGPLLDMTRYHLFDFAAGWSDEYGSPEDEQDCKHLLSYSPYHRVRDGIAYPAVLLISGDADTRCNPMHARKMTARLQAATTSDHPILLDYKPAWGHMPVQPHSSKVETLTDRLAFICHELGVDINHRSS